MRREVEEFLGIETKKSSQAVKGSSGQEARSEGEALVVRLWRGLILLGLLGAALLQASAALGAELTVFTLFSAPPQSATSPVPAAFRFQDARVRETVGALQAAVADRFPHIELNFAEPRIVQDPTQVASAALELLTGEYDLVISDIMPSLIAYDMLMALERFLEHEPIRLSAQYDSLLSQMQREGRLYDLPLAIDPFVLIYVPELFDAVGLPYPEAPWTWSDFARAAERLYYEEDPGILPFSRAGNNVPTPLFGARVHPGALLPVLLAQLETTGLEEDEEALSQAISLLMELHRTPALFSTNTHPADPLALGRAAMEPAYIGQGIRHSSSYVVWWPQRVADRIQWVPRRYPGMPMPFQWGIAPLPTFPGRAPLTEAAVLSAAIPLSSRNTDAAWQVARFFSSREGARIVARTGLLPAYVDEEILGSWLQALQGRGSQPPDQSTAVAALRFTVAGRRHGPLEYRFRAEYPARLAGLFEGRYWLHDALEIAREVRAEVLDAGVAPLEEAR